MTEFTSEFIMAQRDQPPLFALDCMPHREGGTAAIAVVGEVLGCQDIADPGTVAELTGGKVGPVEEVGRRGEPRPCLGGFVEVATLQTGAHMLAFLEGEHAGEVML